jgi:hypothetical protein
MSDVVISSSLVQPGDNAPTSWGISGADLTQPGLLCYIDRADRDRVKKADALTFAKAEVAGVNLNVATTGQPVTLQTDGTYQAGGALTEGQVYLVSTNAGGIAPVTDLSTDSFVSVWGVATSTANIKIARFASGVQKT